MGQGGYIFCEWDSVAKDYKAYREAFRELDHRAISKAGVDWGGVGTPLKCGYLFPATGEFGRTSILPELFDPNPLTYGGAQFGAAAAVPGFIVPPAYWRQYFAIGGNQILIQGCRSGEIIPEDWKIAWIGLAFPNKQMQITEIRFQIGQRKYGRINLEEMHSYNKPAIIFEEGFILDEEEGFELYGYVEQPLDFQRIVMLGAAYYRRIDQALGVVGAVI